MAGLDVEHCLTQGLMAATGAIPGTILAHPADVVKMRIQTSRSPVAPTMYETMHAISRGSSVRWFDGPKPKGSLRLQAFFRDVSPLFRGLTPAIHQKMVTRFFMFLAADASFQTLRATTSLSDTEVYFGGAMLSGYAIGSGSALWEYAKVLQSHNKSEWRATVGDASASKRLTGRGAFAIAACAVRTSNLRSLLRRLHAAGTRNAIFDSCFFGTQHLLSTHGNFSAPESFAFAAATAVAVDYAVDVSVKRMMLVPPNRPVGSLLETVRTL